MSLFQSVLKSISDKLEKNSSKKELIASEISKIIKTSIDKNSINLKNGILKINTNPTIKTAILFKKENIISKLKEIGVEIFSIV